MLLLEKKVLAKDLIYNQANINSLWEAQCL